jgi:hypothetical protein
MWLRNKRTGGWFELPDDEVTKERQISQRQKEADTRNKNSNRADEFTQRTHKKIVEELSDKSYEDGTYDIATKQTVDFDNGYQVTFCQIGDNYSDKEYANKVNECLDRSSNGKVYAGKFESTPEISFHFSNRDEAIRYARANNQISIWDWKNQEEIKTDGTGRRK